MVSDRLELACENNGRQFEKKYCKLAVVVCNHRRLDAVRRFFLLSGLSSICLSGQTRIVRTSDNRLARLLVSVGVADSARFLSRTAFSA